MAVFSSLVGFSCLVAGFDHPRPVRQVSTLLDVPLSFTPGDLRSTPVEAEGTASQSSSQATAYS